VHTAPARLLKPNKPLGLLVAPTPVAAGKRPGEKPSGSVRWFPEDGNEPVSYPEIATGNGSALLNIGVLEREKGWLASAATQGSACSALDLLAVLKTE